MTVPGLNVTEKEYKQLTKDVLDILKDGFTSDECKDLFQNVLKYTPMSVTLKRDIWAGSEKARQEVETAPEIIAKSDDFYIIYTKLKPEGTLHQPTERAIVERLLKNYPYGLYVFSDSTESLYHLVNVRDAKITNPSRRKVYHRITVGTDERLRTAAERIAILYLESPNIDTFEIQLKHDIAFNVDKVTKDFYDKFQGVHGEFMADLAGQVIRSTDSPAVQEEKKR